MARGRHLWSRRQKGYLHSIPIAERHRWMATTLPLYLRLARYDEMLVPHEHHGEGVPRALAKTRGIADIEERR